MSAVIWNPFLFFWLTTKEKPLRTSNFTGIATATSEIFTSLASSFRRAQSLRGSAHGNANGYSEKGYSESTMSFCCLVFVQKYFKACTKVISLLFKVKIWKRKIVF